MRLFAIWIEHALEVAIQRGHHTNPRSIVGPFCLTTNEQRLHCGLPFRRLGFGFGQLGDVGPGVLQRHKLATTGQGNGIVERSFPDTANFATNRFYLWFSHASVRFSGLVRLDVCRPAVVARRAAFVLS